MLVRIVRRCFAKIRISRAQKQFLFAFCRGGVSKTKSKIRKDGHVRKADIMVAKAQRAIDE
jgi:hypothetical protein